jgi:hypothetical protein
MNIIKYQIKYGANIHEISDLLSFSDVSDCIELKTTSD